MTKNISESIENKRSILDRGDNDIDEGKDKIIDEENNRLLFSIVLYVSKEITIFYWECEKPCLSGEVIILWQAIFCEYVYSTTFLFE